MADFSLPDEYVQNATATVAPTEPVAASPAEPAAFTLPNDVVSKAVDEYKVDPNYNPREAALQAQPGSPEWEHAFLVNQAREGMTSAEKKKYGLEPSTSEKLKNAGAGAVQFGVGLVAAPVLGTASIIAQNPSLYKKAINVGSAAVGAPTNLNDEAGPIAKKLQSDSVLAAEKATNPIARAFSDFSKWYERNSPIYDDNPSTDSLSMEGDQFAPKPKDVKTQQARDDFANAVQRYKEDKGLEQGRVQDTGAFAEAAKGAGFAPSDAALTPERQKELGVETSPTEKYLVDAASTAENPENALFALAPEVPGVAAGLKAAGTGLEFAGKGAAKVVGKIPVAAKATGGALGAAGVGYELYQHPIEATAGLGLAGTLMLMRPAGTFIRGAGELAGGMAPAEGASALGLRAKQMLAGGVGGSVIGAATSPEDPEQGAYSGFAMGAGGGALHSPYGAQVAGKRAAMEQFGDSIRTGNDAVDTTHQAIVGKFDPAAKAALDRYRAAAIADGTHLVVTDQAGFNAAMQANGQPDANGVRGVTVGDDKHILTNGPNGSRTIYINADTVGGESGFKGVDTAGHELGHAVVDYLKAQSSKAAADALTQAVASNLTDAEKAEIASKYGQAINAQTTNAPVSPVDENIAEITRKLLAKKDIAEFGLPETLVQKIKGSVSDFFEGTRGDGGGMKWGTKEIVKARRLIEKALYDQGSRATAMRQRASDVAAGKVEPNVLERQKQISARISEIDGLDQTQVTPSILEERAKLTKQASDLAAAEAARTGQTPATPSTGPTIPTASTGPTKNDLLTVKSALVAMGYPARVSEQMAQAAQGGTVEELIKDALARKQPTPISPQTAPATPAQTAAPAAPAPNVGTLTPQTAQGSGQGVTATPTGQLSGFAAPAATATAEAPALAAFDPNAKPTQSPAGTNLPPSVPPVSPGDVATGATPTGPTGVARPVSSPEEVSAAVGSATAAAKATPEYERALKKKAKAKAANDPATEAQADARLETLEREARLDALKQLLPRHEQGSGPAPDELHVSADNFGNESIKGKIDESNPVHREIMAHGEMSPEEIARVKQLQDKTGAISYIDYGSAAKEDNARRHGEQRRAELAASPAQERVEGVGEITEQKNKAVIPVGNTVTAAGRVNTVALSPDKILSNLGSVVRAATEYGLPNGDFSGRPEALNNLAIYLRNQGHGWSGDGTVKVDPTIAPNSKGESLVDAHGQPVDPETAKARMRVFNMAMHDTRATAPTRAEAKQVAYAAAMQAWTDGGEQGPKPRKPRALDPKTKFQAEEGQALAKRYGAMDEATGETNPLRADLEKAGYDTAKELESPWENLRPELIRDIRDSADGKQEIVRPHRVAPADIEGAVTNPPSGKATLAGFMPGEGEPSIPSKVEEAAKEQGYTIRAAHSTNAGPFTVFKTDDLRAHFGTPKAAEDRAQQLRDFSVNTVGREHADARVMPLFLKIENPLKLPDLASLTETERGEIKPLSEAREEWLAKLSKEDQHAWENPDDYEGDIQDEIQKEYGDFPRPMAWESETDFPSLLRDKGLISSDEFWDVQYNPQAAVELLKEKGYDGIEYVNDVEDPGSVSHIIFDPSQVKSAEDFTKDDAGAEIPLSKRFDAKNPDIRFMPDEPSIKSKDEEKQLTRFMPGKGDGTDYLDENGKLIGHKQRDEEINRIVQVVKQAPEARRRAVAFEEISKLPQGMQNRMEQYFGGKKETTPLTPTPIDNSSSGLPDAALAITELANGYSLNKKLSPDEAKKELGAFGVLNAAGFMPGDETPGKDKELSDFKTDKLGFYSGLGKIVDDKLPNKATGEQILGILKNNGAKAEEMEAMGLPEFLQGRKGVTKQEIQDFVDAGGVKLKEVVKGTGSGNESVPMWTARDRHGDVIREFHSEEDAKDWQEKTISKRQRSWEEDMGVYPSKSDDSFVVRDSSGWESDEGFDTEREAQEHLKELARENAENDFSNDYSLTTEDEENPDYQPDSTKFSQYTLPGGKNYKEVVLTIPVEPSMPEGATVSRREADGRWVVRKNGVLLADGNTKEQAIEKASNRNTNGFTSSHFPDEKGYLAHLRTADHTDTQGRDGMVIQEIQSDLHQKGRKEGYAGDSVFKLVSNDETRGYAKEYNTRKEADEALSEMSESQRSDYKVKDFPKANTVPDAPFKATDAWAGLAFKRALRMAVEDGKDFIAWTPGKVHTDQWGTERIEWKEQEGSSGGSVISIKDGYPSVSKGQWKGLRNLGSFDSEAAAKNQLSEIADRWGVPVESLEVKQPNRRFFVDAKAQHGGNAAGIDLEAGANERGMNEKNAKTVSSKEELRDAIAPSLTEGQDADKLAEKLWNRMQGEREGVSMPRKEGFEGFYDKILPDFVRKYVKKWGGKVETIKIRDGNEAPDPDSEIRWIEDGDGTQVIEWDGGRREFKTEEEAKKFRDDLRKGETGTEVHSLTITPAMREAVMKGQPLFMPDAEGGASPEGKKPLEDFRPEGAGMQPSIKSKVEKGQLAGFMPSDFSGRGEVSVKDRSEETDFSPAAMKQRRLADFVAQKPWLDEQAQQLGYEDSDALNAADSDKFNELAEQWRAEHPREDAQGRQLFMPGEDEKRLSDFQRNKNFKKWIPKKAQILDHPLGEDIDPNKPLVVRVDHGSTHQFNEIDSERGNVENHFGKAFYGTDSEVDAGENYAGEGPDLTSRIERRAEALENEIEGLEPEEIVNHYGVTPEQAKLLIDNEGFSYGSPQAKEKNALLKELARKELHGGAPMTYRVWMKMEKPLVIEKDGGTRFDALEKYDEANDSYEENPDSLPVKLYDSIMENAGTYGVDGQKFWSDLNEKIGGDWDGVTAYDVDAAMRKSDALMDAQDHKGDLAGSDFIKEVFRGMGFDGIVMDADEAFGTGRSKGGGKAMEMDYGTRHYIVFDPTQVKSATGNKGTFDPKNPDMRFMPGDESDPLKSLMDKYKETGVDSWVSENQHAITLSEIRVPKDKRGQGVGSQFMEELIKYADSAGKPIVLSPSTDFGGSSVKRLEDFYKRFGFVSNKGRNKDYRYNETMIRRPDNSRLMPDDEETPPKRTWFMRDGKRVYHQRHPDSGQFVPKQTLARFQPGSVQSSGHDKQPLADFAP